MWRVRGLSRISLSYNVLPLFSADASIYVSFSPSYGVIDPLAELEIDIQSFDIPRIVTVYPDRAGVRWWTKAWFNNREEGETSVEIEREQAIRFIHDKVEKDVWLDEFFPKQMEVYRHAIEQTKEQLLKQINI